MKKRYGGTAAVLYCHVVQVLQIQNENVVVVTPQIKEGLEDPKTNSGYKTLVYYSAQAYWRRPVLSQITREIMLF